DDQRFSHTINPTTGFPVNHSLLSASVMANNCMTADAWATAFMVMGLEESIRMVEKQPELDAFFIYSSPDGQFKTWASDGFKSVIVHIIEE
ncbi:MAG TPA: FAD:protein FMN transferase, partial [Bacteroidales bacterium]|nr:FAD:protein FMN transferase [Bacteroidales bacterium]